MKLLDECYYGTTTETDGNIHISIEIRSAEKSNFRNKNKMK